MGTLYDRDLAAEYAARYQIIRSDGEEAWQFRVRVARLLFSNKRYYVARGADLGRLSSYCCRRSPFVRACRGHRVFRERCRPLHACIAQARLTNSVQDAEVRHDQV